jgi:tetratricopeptide (TPR) repeat protein
MSNRSPAELADFQTILDNQRKLGKRFLWLLIVPFVLSIALLAMFYSLNARLTDANARLTDVGRLTQVLTIERYLAQDSNYAMAIDQYEQLDKMQENAPIQARLGVLYFEFDRDKYKDKAIQKLENAKRLDRDYWMTYRNLAYIYVSTGEEKNAIDAGEQALKINAADAVTYNNLAWVYSTSKDDKIRNFERADEFTNLAYMLTHGRNVNVLDTAAEIDFIKGGPANKDLAVSLLNRAISLAPDKETSDRFQNRIKTHSPN